MVFHEQDEEIVANKQVGPSALTLARENLFFRQRAYQTTFDRTSEMDKVVLKDLANFCRADESTFDPDPRIHAVKEGRREVYLRIMSHLNLSSEQLWELVTTGKKEGSSHV